MEKKVLLNDMKRKEVVIKKEGMFEVPETPLFYIQASGHYQQNPRRKRLHHTSIVEQAAYFCWKGP